MSNNGDKKLYKKKAAIENLSTNHNYFNNNISTNTINNINKFDPLAGKKSLSNINTQSLVFNNNTNSISNKIFDKKSTLASISTTAVASKLINSVLDLSNNNNNINTIEMDFLNNKNANDDTTIEEIMKSRKKVELWLQQNQEYFLCKPIYDE
jgi:hypothetical protein